MKEYYCQRASVPGTLLITEPNLVSKTTVGLRNAPGLFTREQTAAWKTIVEEVVRGLRKERHNGIIKPAITTNINTKRLAKVKIYYIKE